MPVMTGWECSAQIVRLPAPPPIVFMTAGPAAQEEATRHQAAGYLAQPFGLDELESVVERVLRDRSRPAGEPGRGTADQRGAGTGVPCWCRPTSCPRSAAAP